MRPYDTPALVSAAPPNSFGVSERVSRVRWTTFLVGLIAPLLAFVHSAAAIDYDAAEQLYRTGKYEEALTAAEASTVEYVTDVRWWRLRLECLATLGRYRDGAAALKVAQRRYYADAGIRLLGSRLLQGNNQQQEGRELLTELLRIATYSSWQFRSAEDRVAVGRAALMLGGDARQILEQFFDPALLLDPEARDVYLASGELALLKHDHKLAAETLEAALKKFPDDSDVLCQLARAIADESPTRSRALIVQALATNPRHVPSLLWLAENALEHEEHAAAEEWLQKIHAISPLHPRAWADRAVLAHLRNHPAQEQASRDVALCTWKENPEVDYWIGHQLSRAYRFAAGAAYQRKALQRQADYLPARTQLAQDLLRLGQADEGWQLVSDVQEADAYDVVAFNLATLHDHLTNYETLETPHFTVNMERREAAVFGERVTSLLERAHEALGDKYGWRPTQKITVEMLADQRDFAIRTFGVPGGDGILGVCFGPVITANSPSALKTTHTNWEATLWHEYCHVVTLGLTGHRIPRWLSEGISVYEEQQANPTWGNRLNPQTRQMVLEGQLTDVSELNQAFRNPRSAAHFNLAYYEASLVVQFFVDRLGHETLRRLLSDVAAGMPINAALELRTGSLTGFEQAFAAYARQVAREYGQPADWNDHQEPPLPKGPSSEVATWLKRYPKHYRGRVRYAQLLIDEKQWPQAQAVLETLVADVPELAGDDSPYMLLSRVYRAQDNTADERRILRASAARDDAAVETYQRLIDLAAQANDHQEILEHVERYLAVQPQQEFPHLKALEAAEQLHNLPRATQAARSLLALDPPDIAGAHYRLARLLHAQRDPAAKRHALQALEETPRYRDAQRLLLKIIEAPPPVAQESQP